MIRTLIADDEPLAREGLRRSLATRPEFLCVGESRDGLETVEAVLRTRPDLVLLDVQMPGCDGFDVVDRVRRHHLPGIVFVSAFDRHAVRAFEFHAVDYLLKPYEEERLSAALARARRDLLANDPCTMARLLALLGSRAAGAAHADRFTVRTRDGWRFVPVAEVRWCQSAGNYVELHTASGSHLVRMTMSDLERAIDPQVFRRIHRTALVRVDLVCEVRSDGSESYTVHLDDGTRLPMTRRHRDALLGASADPSPEG